MVVIRYTLIALESNTFQKKLKSLFAGKVSQQVPTEFKYAICILLFEVYQFYVQR